MSALDDLAAILADQDKSGLGKAAASGVELEVVLLPRTAFAAHVLEAVGAAQLPPHELLVVRSCRI